MRTWTCWLLMALGVACAQPAPKAEPPLTAGASGDYPPFSALRGARYEGFAIDLVEAFARTTRRRVAFTPFRWPELVPALVRGDFELAASGISVRPERSVRGRYSLPVATTGSMLLLVRPAWLAAGGDQAALLAALDRPEFRLGVNAGGHLERTARATFPHATITTGPNESMPERLAHHEVDGLLTNTIEAPRWAAHAGAVEQVGPFTREDVALWLRAEAGPLARELDDYLLASEQSGELSALRARHLGPGLARTAEPGYALLAATSERLALMPHVRAEKERAGLAIDDPAQEARVLARARDGVRAAAASHGVTYPGDEVVERVFATQIELAKRVQRADGPLPEERYDLANELRPAIARIGQRMELLVPLVAGRDVTALSDEACARMHDARLDDDACRLLVDSLAHAARR